MGEGHQVREHHSGLMCEDPYSSRSCKERALLLCTSRQAASARAGASRIGEPNFPVRVTQRQNIRSQIHWNFPLTSTKTYRLTHFFR
jgi:hypothetical protein